MIGIILMAGCGRRLIPLTNTIPKGLLIIRDATLLERIVENCSLNGINEFIIVTGYYNQKVQDFSIIVEDLFDVSIECVYNSKFNESGTALSALIGCNDLNDDILLINGDLVLDSKIFPKIISSKTSSILNDYGTFVGVTKIIKSDLEYFKDSLSSIVDEDISNDYDLAYSLLSDKTNLKFSEVEDLKWIAIKNHNDWDNAQLLVDDFFRE